MAKFNLDASDESTIYPVFGCDATGLSNDGAEVTLCKADATGVVGYLVLFVAVLIDKTDETVEDGLFAGVRYGLVGDIATIEFVIVMHQCSNYCGNGGAVVVGLMDDVPKRFDDVAGRGYIVGCDGNLEVAHLSVEG